MSCEHCWHTAFGRQAGLVVCCYDHAEGMLEWDDQYFLLEWDDQYFPGHLTLYQAQQVTPHLVLITLDSVTPSDITTATHQLGSRLDRSNHAQRHQVGAWKP